MTHESSWGNGPLSNVLQGVQIASALITAIEQEIVSIWRDCLILEHCRRSDGNVGVQILRKKDSIADSTDIKVWDKILLI